MTTPSNPNILIVVIDSLRADHVSCYGYHRETTPNIDRLASEGCLFETAITAAPFSPASYASIFSNLYPHQHGVNGDTVRIWPDTWPRLPELLQQQGYFTFCISNNSFVSRATNCDRGFDVFADMRFPSRLDRLQERLIQRIRRSLGDGVASRLSSNRNQCLAKGSSTRSAAECISLLESSTEPFFGFMILMDPHTPYRKVRLRRDELTSTVRRYLKHRNRRTTWANLMAERTGLSDSELRVAIDLYDAEIRHADRCVGRIVDFLRSTGRLDDTILVVTSDHGEAFGERGVWGHGFCLSDCLTRVPLLARCPRYWAGASRSPAIVQLHDLHDLCLSVSADNGPDPQKYKCCLTQAADSRWKGREYAFSEFPRQSKTLQFMRDHHAAFSPGLWNESMWAVRTDSWRYVEYDGGTCELFDLQLDPSERESVHASHPERCNEFRLLLEAHRSDRSDEVHSYGENEEMEEVVLERLRALGYID